MGPGVRTVIINSAIFTRYCCGSLPLSAHVQRPRKLTENGIKLTTLKIIPEMLLRSGDLILESAKQAV